MSSHEPTVSIGVPVYNGERYLGEALDSLLAQTFDDFDLIVCDNASTDGTEDIGRAYEGKDSRIRYVRNEKNLGAAANYRLSFDLSIGRYFKWAACDDRCAPEFLGRCVEVLDRQADVVLAYPKTRLIGEAGEVLSDYEDDLHLIAPRAADRFSRLFRNLRLCHPLYGLIRAAALSRTALVGNYVGGDIPLLAELTLHGKFWEVPEYLFYRRFHPAASSSYKSDAQVMEFFDPRLRKTAPLTEWRHFGAYFRAVRRSPITVSEKLLLAWRLLHMMAWHRRALIDELGMVARLTFRRASGR